MTIPALKHLYKSTVLILKYLHLKIVKAFRIPKSKVDI